MTDLDSLKTRLRDFAEARDWLQFHDPKNLAMAIASEAGELLAEFRWLSSEQSKAEFLSDEKIELISMEMADVLIFLIRLSDVLQVDLVEVATTKLDRNETRFPKLPNVN